MMTNGEDHFSSDYDRFVAAVQQATGLEREPAEGAIQATLQTLAERIDAGEARDLIDRLPPELAPWLGTKTGAQRFDVDEFLRRTAGREGVDVEVAQRHVQAVFDALALALDPDELDDLVAELSKDYWPLLPRGPEVEVLPAQTFLERVADRAGTDLDTARRATDAVLETLATRIAGGEIDDLIARLPIQLHGPLKRGRDRTGGKATRMSLDQFVRRVAELEGVQPADALRHARAVMLTLREAVGELEWLDVTAQLPDDYLSALAGTSPLSASLSAYLATTTGQGA